MRGGDRYIGFLCLELWLHFGDYLDLAFSCEGRWQPNGACGVQADGWVGCKKANRYTKVSLQNKLLTNLSKALFNVFSSGKGWVFRKEKRLNLGVGFKKSRGYRFKITARSDFTNRARRKSYPTLS